MEIVEMVMVLLAHWTLCGVRGCRIRLCGVDGRWLVFELFSPSYHSMRSLPIIRSVFVRDALAEMVTSSTILEGRFFSHVISLKLDDRDHGRLKLV